ADLPGFADFDGLAGLFLDMVDLGSGGFGDNRPCMTKMRMARAQARVPMESRRAAATATLKQARRQIDGALSRDRGRLLGLWSRWNARPADAPAGEAFSRALQASVQARETRAARLPAATVADGLPIT